MSAHSVPRSMPAVFFGHGSPANTLERNRYTAAWSALGATLPLPSAVVVVSAHWYVPGIRVSAARLPRTVHDFNRRFAPALFAFEYPATGSLETARRIAELLAPANVAFDDGWGIDHGAYSVLAHAYPGANVPVVQLSLDRTLPADEHYRLATRLAPLRDEGVLVIGSGNVVHNLELARFDARDDGFAWARRRDERIQTLLAGHDHERLVGYHGDGDDARLAVPTPDHYLPFLYVLALQRPHESFATFAQGIEAGSLSMLSMALGA